MAAAAKKATVAPVGSAKQSATPLERSAYDIILQELPGFLIRRLDSRAAAVYEKFTGQSELTPRQFGVLLTLFQSGPLAQTELGNRLHLDRNTLGEMLQRMVEKKIVERRPHAHDRRAVEIMLTDAGKSALLGTVQQALKAQEELLAPLPVYLRPVFLKCLEILAAAERPVD
jgi:MarR family transcriptional regulator, temperature-dependent positive regulator of motility